MILPILTLLKYYTVIVVVVTTTTSSSFANTVTTAFVIKTTATKSCSTRLFFEQSNKNKQHNNNKYEQQQQQQQHGTNSTSSTSFASTELMSSLSSATVVAASSATTSSSTKYKIYCDLDGCLVNFEKGVQTLLNTGSSNLDKRTMWDSISQVPNWFDKLEWTMDGRRLWNTIKHLNPDILTGVPDIESSRIDKFNWCKRELGLDEQIVHHVDMAADGLEIPILGVDVGLPAIENNVNNNNNDDSYAWDDNDHGCSQSWTDDHLSVNGNVPRDDMTNVITCWSNNKYKECRTGS